LRTGKHLAFSDINLSLTRPKEGGVAFAINSKGTDGPSSLTATVTPAATAAGWWKRCCGISLKDLMLALGFDSASFEAKMPISAILRSEIGPDGVPEIAEGRIVLGAGYIGNPTDEENRIVIDEAHVNLRWDATTRQITMPIDALAGAKRISLLATIEAPLDREHFWQFSANLSNSSADQMVHNLKVEVEALHVSANEQGIDVAGAHATINGQLLIPGESANVQIQVAVDDALLNRLGWHADGELIGLVALIVTGRIGFGERNSHFNIDADLTQTTIKGLLPGWNKPAGGPTRATAFLTFGKQNSTLDVVIDANGPSAKGNVEIDKDNKILGANFTMVNLPRDGKFLAAAERSSDGRLIWKVRPIM
jgi:hypothetical protein